MDFIEDFKQNTNKYAKKIKTSRYLEKPKQMKKPTRKITDICELIIGNNEIEYNSLNDSIEKLNFIKKKKIDIASNIELSNGGPYIRKFKSQLIQNGLQSMNCLSTILYLNEKYKVACIIYNEDTEKYYLTTYKSYPKLVCSYSKNGWSIIETFDEKNVSKDISYLSNILTIDIDTIFIKISHLNSLSKYKINELEEIAKKENLPLVNQNGKKKLKKELYDDINLKYYSQDI